MPFVEGGLVEDVVSSPRQSGGFVEGGLSEPLTPDDSYQRVIQYEQGASDETPSKDEYLAYLQAKKTKPLLGERPMATLGEAALETGKMLATLPYRAGEAVGDVIMPQLTQEGLTPMDVAVATGAEVAARSELGARRLSGGLQETLLSEIDNLAQRFGQTLRSDDDKYQAFLGLADVKRKLAKAQSGEQLASQEFLQAYNLPQEAISQAGLEVGGFLAAPENIAFAGGGKLAGQLLGGTARALPAISGAAQRTGARIGTAARVPEVQAGRAVTAITGSEAAGQAVERAIGTGTTGVAAAEALGLPVAGNIPIPGAGMAASAIGTAKAIGTGLETLGEAGAISGGEALSPIQRGLLGFGERIAAQEGASRTARAFGNVLARTGADVIVPKTASILVPALGAGAAGGLLAGMTGEEGDQIAAAIGSGFAFGGIESGIRMAAAKGVFDANRVRSTATEDLNTRPNDVQFTYIEPTTKAEQTVTLKDRDARAQLYEQLDDKQLVKALSEIANAENAGVDVVFHKDGDPVPQDLQQVRYKGVALSTDSVKSGRPTILVNVDKAAPETIPHEILHARITSDMVARIGSQIIEGNIDKAQFKSFANKYAKAMLASGAPAKAKAIFDQVKSAFDPKLQRAQRIDALRYMADEFAAYYTQEFLAGKDPKTVLPGRLPSFFEAAFNSAKEAVSDKFTQKALQSGFDPIAKTFYGPDGKRIKIPWMDDAIKQLIIERKGFEPSEQKLDMRKLTPNQQAALVMSRGFEDLYILNPDGSIGRPKTGQELKLQDIDIAQRSIKLLDSLPAADRGTVTGLDAKGNTIIEGRLSLAEADALARSGIYSASTSRYLGEIARAIVDGSLLNGSYWKVYGRSGRPGVFGESQKLFLPYGIRLNSAGGVIVKVVDFGKVQARMDAALQKQAYKNLFRSYDQAMSTLRDVYLKNLADPNGKPSAEALGGGVEGAKKRNFFNEVMGAVPKKGDVMINEPTAGYTASRKGGSVYEDLRIERVQNVEQTGMKIPWSGDMGEQSSYRRTQLNFQPAETIGDKSVESDANAGFRILSSRGKFRLYSPDGDLLGIYDSAGQAKLKAEKTYATQTRVQSENDQQQRLPGDEGRQTAEAGNRNRALDRTQGREEGGQALGQVRQAGDVGARFMPSSLTARDINAIAEEVGGGDVKGGAKAFGAFMRSMRDKGITLRDVIKSYGITLSSIQRQELSVSTIKKNWPDAPFAEGTKVRPEDAFAQLLGTPEGQQYLNAAERGVFDEQAADAVVQKFRSFGFHNKLKEQMKTAVEQFYPKAQEIIDAVNSMPTDQFIDYVRNNFKGISYGKVGFWSGQLGRGDIPTFDSRQGKLVYGKEVPVTKKVLMEQKDRLTQLGIKVPAEYKEFAQTLLHHEVWDRLNQSDTEHGPIKEAMLRFMPSDAEYLSAVEAGDTAKAQELVDQAAKAAGYAVGPVWHGTNAEFTEFKRGDLGIHFGTKEQAAGRGGTREIRAFLKAKPIRIDDDPGFWMGRKIVNLLSNQGVNKTELTKLFNKAASEGGSSGEPNSSADILARGLIGLGIDSIQYPNKFEGIGDSVVVLDPSQIKSADPITRDDSGNIIPLSQRFQQGSSDIRYMPALVPDPSIPGAYSMSGYRILPGKTKGKLRVYSPSGALAGVVGSVDDAQRMIQKKLQ